MHPMPLNQRRCHAERLRRVTNGEMRRARERISVQSGTRPA